MRISSSCRISSKLLVKRSAYGSSGNSRRSKIRFTVIFSPALAAMLCALRHSTSATPEPTTPCPNIAIEIIRFILPLITLLFCGHLSVTPDTRRTPSIVSIERKKSSTGITS